MIELLKGYEGPVTVNGIEYDDIQTAIQVLGEYEGPIDININGTPVKPKETTRKHNRSVFQWIR